jgi:hypothetical protein
LLNRYSNSPALHLVPHDAFVPACLIGCGFCAAAFCLLASQGRTGFAAGVLGVGLLVIANQYRRWQRVLDLLWSGGSWQVRTSQGWQDVRPTSHTTALGGVVFLTLVGYSSDRHFARCLLIHTLGGRNAAANLRRLRVRLRLEGCL